jgi:thiol-disulfide isomerase/thioredoxin
MMLSHRLRHCLLAYALAAVAVGCTDTVTPTTTSVFATPPEVLAPEPPATATATAAPSPKAEPTSDKAPPVKLQRLKFDDFHAKVLVNPKAKFTLVDAWATNCGPCKENFPHLVAMHRKFAAKGLAVVSLSLDDPSQAKDVAEAEKFLREQKAEFTNVLLDEEAGVGYEKLDINAIPAVFLYGPDGKQVRRFTMDDPDNQFTYDQVEKAVAEMLKEAKSR